MCPLSLLHSHPLIQNIARIARELCVPVYLVGGAVRDALRNVEYAHDFDFALAEGFDELVTRFARENHGKIIPWDVDQKRIVFHQGNTRITVDFSRMHTPDIMHDLNKRDFTLNAMALGIHESEAQLIDPLGGQDDLSTHCLRMCSSTVFEADPLRMLRAVRFARQLSCVIEPRTREHMRLSSSLITRSATERIKREFFMIMRGPSQQTSLRELYACGLLEAVLPDDVSGEILSDDFEQSSLIIGVLEDALQQPDARLDGLQQQLCDYVSKDFEEGVSMTSLLMFAVLLCNICKFDNVGVEGRNQKKITKAIQQISREMGLGRKAQNMLADLVENQGRILHLTQHARLTKRMKMRFILDCGEAAVGICLLAIADSLAIVSNSGSKDSCQRVSDIAYDLCVWILGVQDLKKISPLLVGDDVIGSLGLGAGPRIGEILSQAAQLERDGILHNRNAALLWLENLPNNV